MLGRVGKCVVLWWAAAFVYSFVFAAPVPAWAIADVVTAATALIVVRISLGELAGAVVAIAAVLAIQLVVADRNGIWLDESNYLATLHAGHPIASGALPFCVRWLEPVLAGPLNILPARGADALKAINFGALVVTAAYLAKLIVRLGAKRSVAWLASAVLLCSYLGSYAATNRLLTDPFNYALFVLIAGAIFVPGERRGLPWLLLVTACNTEKVVYWIPVIVAQAIIERRGWRVLARELAPVLAYLAIAAVYFSGAQHASGNSYSSRIAALGFASQHDDVTFQMVWMPFGAMSLFALLGLRRELAALALLAVPVALSILVASDAQRMSAYLFVVVLPLGALYLTDVVDSLPRLGLALVIAIAACACCQTYLPRDHRELVVAIELGATFAIVWLHAVRSRSSTRVARSPTPE